MGLQEGLKRRLAGAAAAGCLAVTLAVAPAAAASDGTRQWFTTVRVAGPGGETIQAWASGPVFGTGRATEIHFDPSSMTGWWRLAFERGSVVFAFQPTAGDSRPTKQPCVTESTVRGDYALREGTGAFSGVSGTGRFTVHTTTIDVVQPDGTCSQDGRVEVEFGSALGETSRPR